MIGLIITGHGHFATGMQSALRVIAGDQNDICYIDFEMNHSIEMLEQHFEEALQSLQHCEGILILADLVGGSPFKTAALYAMKEPAIEVIGGISLPMIIDLSLSRNIAGSLEELASQALQTGQENIIRFVKKAHEEQEEEGGI